MLTETLQSKCIKNQFKLLKKQDILIFVHIKFSVISDFQKIKKGKCSDKF